MRLLKTALHAWLGFAPLILLSLIPPTEGVNLVAELSNAMQPISAYIAPLNAVGGYINFATANILDDFFEHATMVKEKVQAYAEQELQHIAKSYEGVSDQIDELHSTVSELLSISDQFEQEVSGFENKRGTVLQRDFSELFAKELAEILEWMKDQFPDPKEAPHHKEREEMVLKVLDKVEERFLRLATESGYSQDSARDFFARTKRLILKIMTVIGDLCEQHPRIRDSIIIMVVLMIIPESWILRPILSLFGFGPYGPIKGSAAAWIQSVYWGGAVAEGSWFAVLQRLGMTTLGGVFWA